MAEAERLRDLIRLLCGLVAETDPATLTEAESRPNGNVAHCEAPVSPPNPEWRWLSPLEEQVLAVVRTDADTSAERIADALKIPCSGEFRFLLRNLVSRQILDSSPKGYRLRQPAPG